MADKEKIAHGLRNLAIALPLMFAGPTILHLWGIRSIENGTWIGFGIALFIMAAAVYFMVQGIRQMLKGFFQQEINFEDTEDRKS
jgi:small neutral amino acid transporter SnatA (MarC family)